MAYENTEKLLKRLKNDVFQLKSWGEQLLQVDTFSLQQQPAPGKWSAAQVLEHLNSYGRYYHPEIQKVLKKGQGSVPAIAFQSGWLGAYFTKTMRPDEKGKISSKMQSPKDHRPAASLDAIKVVQEFISQQTQLLQYLEKAAHVNLTQLKVPISLSRFVTIRLGDTFQFVIAHELRHQLQAIRALTPETALQTANGNG